MAPDNGRGRIRGRGRVRVGVRVRLYLRHNVHGAMGGDSCRMNQSQNVMAHSIIYIPFHCRARSSMPPSMGK